MALGLFTDPMHRLPQRAVRGQPADLLGFIRDRYDGRHSGSRPDRITLAKTKIHPVQNRNWAGI